MRLLIARDLLRVTGGDHLAAHVAALGSQVDQPVGGFDDIEVVLDNQQRRSRLKQFAKGGQQLSDVVKMQPGCWLIEDVENALIFSPREVGSELEPLRFSTGKCCGRLSQAQVAEADFIQHL